MIKSGVDGLSRGDKISGVMLGEQMLGFVPLANSVNYRSPKLVNCLADACRGSDGTAPRVLFPSHWPKAWSQGSTYIWTPPPAAVAAASEYVANFIHLNPCVDMCLWCLA